MCSALSRPYGGGVDEAHLAGFRAGADTLRAFDVIELGDVTGQALLHLQCKGNHRAGLSESVSLDVAASTVGAFWLLDHRRAR